MVELQQFLVLGAALFCIGMYGALARRNAIVVLMSIELMLNGINITFVAPGTDMPTVADGIDLALETSNQSFVGQVNTYDANGVLLDTWALTRTGFCYEPPNWLDFYHFSAPGRIARVECILQVVKMDNVIVTEASTPVEGSTWGKIKALYP